MNNFYYALSLLNTMYGVDMDEEDFAEIALVGWNLIGNKRTKLYRSCKTFEPCEKEYKLELPCNCDILEAVTGDFEDFAFTSGVEPDGVPGSSDTEEYIEGHKAFKQPLYAKGKFINYERVGDTLYFTQPVRKVNLLYRGLVADENGLPEITDAEALALATYVAYINRFKEGLMTNNTNIISIGNVLKAEWEKRCVQARSEFNWTQNDYDEVLDAKSCWDRKIYNRSYKLER